MLSASDIPYLLPILFAFVVGAAIFSTIFEKSRSGVKTAISLAIMGVLSLAMSVVTLSYLLGADCVFRYEPRKLRVVAEYMVGVVVYGVIGLALIWWVARAKR